MHPSKTIQACCTVLLLALFFAYTSQAQSNDDAASVSQTDDKLILFMVGEREYKTAESLNSFADSHLLPWAANANVRFTFVFADPDNPNEFHGIEKLKDADLLVLSVRRRTLPSKAFSYLRAYFDSNKPLVAIRTSSHPFHLRKEAPPAGHEEWRTFDADILGHTYEGHYGKDLLPTITPISGTAEHPLMAGVTDLPFVSSGSLYQSRNLAGSTHALLEGSIVEKGERRTEPVAWINELGKQRIFYTSLGHPDDFKEPAFLQMLHNAVRWTLER